MWANQHFLFNRGMQDTLGGHETGSFVCGNDPMDFRIYTTFLVGYLYSTNRIKADERYNLQTALMELLTNALEHGNCNISYEEKSEWLANGGNILSLIEEKNKNPEIASRKIHIAYAIGKTKSKFVIRDEGNGFDWKGWDAENRCGSGRYQYTGTGTDIAGGRKTLGNSGRCSGYRRCGSL